MSLTKEIQTTIQKALEYSSHFGNATFRWDPNEKKLYLKDESHFQRGMRLKLIILWSFGTLMMYETVTNPKIEGIVIKSQASFTCAIVLMGGDMVRSTLNNYKTTMQSINELVKLEMELEKGGNKLPKNKFAIVGILCKIILESAKSVCFAFGLPAVFMPEFPTNLFLSVDRFFPQTDEKLILLIITRRILFGVGNVMIWYVIHTAALFLWLEMIFALTCMRGCLLMCLRKVYTKQPQLTFGFYKRLSLLVKIFNEAYSSVVVHMLATVACVQSLAAFILLRAFRSNDEMPLIAIFCNLIAIINISTIILGVYGYAGKVYGTSISLIKSILTNEKVLRSRVGRRTAISLSSLQIKFGGSNFIDKRTPLVFLDFNIGRTVDLLLIDKRLV